MRLNIENIFNLSSFESARLLVGEDESDNQISEAMVMEALDIKEWGMPGQILLTSYFAFKDSSLEEIDLFFSQAKEIGVAGFIFKTDRLVKEIPSIFLSMCNQYNFPLIQVPGNIKYSKIINEVSEAVSNNNNFLLKTYYENHQKFIQLMMKQVDLLHILNTLESIIRLPITLNENTNKKSISTYKEIDNFKKIRDITPTQDINSNINYKNFIIKYTNTNKTDKILSIPIPTLGYEDYELLIHEVNDPLPAVHLTTIENTVIALQTELVKRYALKKNDFSHSNEITSKLIYGYLTDKDEIKDIIENLGLSIFDDYRIVIFDFKNLEKNHPLFDWDRFIDKFVYFSENILPDIAFVQQSYKVALIVPMENYSLATIKDKVTSISAKVTDEIMYKDITIQITISNEVSAFNLAEGYKQAKDTQLVVDLWENRVPIVAYEDIGIFQLFLEIGNIDSIKHFIPEEIWYLRSNKPELFETLYTFINVNQKYSETAKILYIHPKTVRYRVDQLESQYNIDFEDSEKLLFYNIAMHIIKYFKHKEDKTV